MFETDTLATISVSPAYYGPGTSVSDMIEGIASTYLSQAAHRDAVRAVAPHICHDDVRAVRLEG